MNLQEESLNMERSKSSSTLLDVYHQIPFFTCPNNIFDKSNQEDITKYIYCENTKTPLYKTYGETAKIWIEKHFLIKHALSVLNKETIRKSKKKDGTG
tara:strand:+ start:13102 stop:13395 length:294 start_codon:yes stop_codon:yes gene_type:complete